MLVEPGDGEGVPDGLTVDEEGALWVGFWGGGAVRRSDATGRPIGEIQTGAPLTTSCCLGGADGRTLFIISASNGMAPEQLTEVCASGHLLCARVETPGPPARPFRGALAES